jgi:hypothetical protein
MKKQHRTAKESYRIRTHLIHGNHESKHWDFDHHLVPPISASAAYRLGSVHRGAQGFVEFASDEADVKGHVPIYIYDRLDEPTAGMLEEHPGLCRGRRNRSYIRDGNGGHQRSPGYHQQSRH